MLRRSFVSRGLVAAALAGASPLPALGQTSATTTPLTHLVNEIPGDVAIFARTMTGGPPLFAYDDTTPYSSASIIKLAIMLTAFHALERGEVSPSTPIVVNARDMVGGSDYLAAAIPGSTYRLMDLVIHMIRQSDNTASNALISHFTYAYINAVCDTFGLPGTRIYKHFLDSSAVVKRNLNVTTARDCGTLLYALERGAREGITTVATPASCRHMIAIMLGQKDRDKIPAGLPRGTPVANKTGEISGVRNDAAIVDPFGDTPYVLVVLTKHLRDEGYAVTGIRRISARVNALVKGQVG